MSAEKNPDGATPEDLSDLVPGRIPEIDLVLQWVEELDRQRKHFAKALGVALRTCKSISAASAVLFARVQRQAEIFGETLREPIWRGVVAEKVTLWLLPLINDAAAACDEIRGLTAQHRLPPRVVRGLLARIMAPDAELRSWWQ